MSAERRQHRAIEHPFASLVLVALLAGCVGVVHTPSSTEPGQGRIAPVLLENPAASAYFAYERTARPSQIGLPRLNPKYNVYRLAFPVARPLGAAVTPFDDTTSVGGLYFESRLPGRHPLVIVLPIWGSYTYPPTVLAKRIRRQSKGAVNVFLVDGDSPLIDTELLAAAQTEAEFVATAETAVARVRSTVMGVRGVMDWAQTAAAVDPDRVGLVGFSMGAIVSAMVLGSDPRFDTGVLVMGAANPGEIFATCEGRWGRAREEVMARLGWSMPQYQGLFERLFWPGDPARFSGRYDPSRLLIIEAAYDNCMSDDARAALWRVTGKPERVQLLGRHKESFLAMTPLGLHYGNRKIYAFLRDQLQLERGVVSVDERRVGDAL